MFIFRAEGQLLPKPKKRKKSSCNSKKQLLLPQILLRSNKEKKVRPRLLPRRMML